MLGFCAREHNVIDLNVEMSLGLGEADINHDE